MNLENSQLYSHKLYPEPDLAFHPEREEDKHKHPLKGLVEFGPYSQGHTNQIYNPVRLAMITPFGKQTDLTKLVAELESRHSPQERAAYLIPFEGFSTTFRLRLASGGTIPHIELSKTLDNDLHRHSNPSVLLAEELSKAISAIKAQRTNYDVLLVYLPSSWSSGFYGKNDDFDLHDFLKGLTASNGIPLQIITDNAFTYRCRASVMWRLSTAIYCKAGGVPWKLANSSAETAYIGISYAVRKGANGPRFVTCCSQVFDSDGSGLEFLAYETNEVHQDYENPFLSRSEMRRVIARSLRLYQLRHCGRLPQKLVVHKPFNFSHEEVDGCFDAWSSPDNLHIIQINQSTLWRGISFEKLPGAKTATPTKYPLWRGTSVQLDGKSCLLWTQGNSPTAVGGKDFYKEGKGIPRPLLLVRHAGHGSWDEDCNSILGLSKMNWNNDGLYDVLPVTIGFSEVLAKAIKCIPDLAPRPYEFRFFI